MSEATNTDKIVWIERVLGVRVALTAMPEDVSAGVQPTVAVAKGTVNYAKLLLRWRAAQNSAAANLVELGRRLLALPEVQADPLLPSVTRAVTRLTSFVPEFGETLADHLDAAANDGPDAADRRRAALATLADYRAKLADAPVLAELEGFARRTLGANLPIFGALDAALAELQATLTQTK